MSFSARTRHGSSYRPIRLQNFHQNILWTDELTFTRIGLFNLTTRTLLECSRSKSTRNAQGRFPSAIIHDRVSGPYFVDGRLTGSRYLENISYVVKELLGDATALLNQNLLPTRQSPDSLL